MYAIWKENFINSEIIVILLIPRFKNVIEKIPSYLSFEDFYWDFFIY